MYIIYCMHLCIHVNQCQRNPGALRSHWWGWSYDMQLAKDQDHTSNRGRIHYRVDDHLSSGENMFHTETVLPPGNVWVLGRINGINTYDASLPIIWPYLFVQKKISFLYIAISSITSIYFLHSAGWSPDFFCCRNPTALPTRQNEGLDIGHLPHVFEWIDFVERFSVMICCVTNYSTLPEKQVLIHFPQLKTPLNQPCLVASSMAHTFMSWWFSPLGTLRIWRIPPLRANDRIRNETRNLFSLHLKVLQIFKFE